MIDFNAPTPTPTADNIVTQMRDRTAQLYGALVLEQAGIRDGDGSWIGSDPIGGAIEALAALHRDLEALHRERLTA